MNRSFIVALMMMMVLMSVTLAQQTFGQPDHNTYYDHHHLLQQSPAWLSPQVFESTPMSTPARSRQFPLWPSSISSPSSNPMSLLAIPQHLESALHKLVVSPIDALVHLTFDSFMQLYCKNYSLAELPRRMSLFSRTKQVVLESLRNYQQGLETFVLKINQFSDWSDDELKALNGARMSQSALRELQQLERRPSTVRVRATERIPAQKDWRTSGCVSAPYDQQKCGCCWAIAPIGVVEAKNCLVNGASAKLSPQQLVDCSTPRQGYRNWGCNGGWPSDAFRYIFRQSSLTHDSCYPLVKKQQMCRADKVRRESGCSTSASNSFGNLRYKTLKGESEILYHVAKTGPVAVVMQATRKFTLYWKGIFDDPECTRRSRDHDHALQVVGYGTDNGQDYWLLKNSWGTADWGEFGGYARIKRGVHACSIGYIGWAVVEN